MAAPRIREAADVLRCWSAGSFWDRAIGPFAGQAGENVPRLLLTNDRNDNVNSQRAGITDSNPTRLAHALQGAAIPDFFVELSVPLARVGIAEGVCCARGRRPRPLRRLVSRAVSPGLMLDEREALRAEIPG